jgi:hypothetical protein
MVYLLDFLVVVNILHAAHGATQFELCDFPGLGFDGRPSIRPRSNAYLA